MQRFVLTITAAALVAAIAGCNATPLDSDRCCLGPDDTGCFSCSSVGAECVDEADCASDISSLRCIEGTCIEDCTENDACDCQIESDCSPDRRCADGACVCREAVCACDSGADGTCSCDVDGDCPAGNVCDDDVCILDDGTGGTGGDSGHGGSAGNGGSAGQGGMSGAGGDTPT